MSPPRLPVVARCCALILLVTGCPEPPARSGTETSYSAADLPAGSITIMVDEAACSDTHQPGDTLAGRSYLTTALFHEPSQLEQMLGSEARVVVAVEQLSSFSEGGPRFRLLRLTLRGVSVTPDSVYLTPSVEDVRLVPKPDASAPQKWVVCVGPPGLLFGTFIP